LSGFFEPLFYLLSMRIGLGNLIGTVSVDGHEVPYDHFVAPALMAASAMNGRDLRLDDERLLQDESGADLRRRVGDADVAGRRRPRRDHVGPDPRQLYAIGFLVVMWALGLVGSPWVIMALPFCALIGLAFASLGFAVTTFMRGFSDFEFVPTATMPMFLFSHDVLPDHRVRIVGLDRAAVALVPRRRPRASRQHRSPSPWRASATCWCCWPSPRWA
jgi:lipooligosaccharide transport system permease protein